MKRLIILLIILMATGTSQAESLREKLNSLTDTPAARELGRDRRRAAL